MHICSVALKKKGSSENFFFQYYSRNIGKGIKLRDLNGAVGIAAGLSRVLKEQVE